jgi:Protein of unknown function (DUF4058)
MLRSPFPGMDPYLESTWGNIHTHMVSKIGAQLQPLLPRDLRARVTEHVTVDAESFHQGRYPDVRIVERPGLVSGAREKPAASMTAEPLVLELGDWHDDPLTERWIEIRETATEHQLVTVIELLSPTNKRPGPNRDAYLQRQRELKWSNANLVEIDLLRQWKHVLPVSDDQIPEDVRSPYRVSVWRSGHPRQLELFRIGLRERLPRIAIPLRETDADVPLDLQESLDYCYEISGYDDTDYTVDPAEPLSPDDAKWADELLRAKGLRR